MVKKYSTKGRKPSLNPEQLIQLAKNSIGVYDPYFAEVLIFYIEKLFFLEPKIQRLQQILMDEIDKQQHNQLKLLSSIKGISEKLAGLFLAEIQDIKNFPNHKKLIKYAGTDPVIKQSGKYKLRMSISKQGSPFLRNILFQMAVGVVKWNPCLREYFHRKKQHFGSYKKAMIALVNKLIRIIYAICTKAEPFKEKLVKPICSLEVAHV
jgi:transposase